MFDLAERSPMAVAIVAPHGDLRTTSAQDLLRRVATSLEAKTDLGVEPVRAQALLDCKGRLACMVRRVRSDVDPSRSIAPRMDERSSHTPYLLVISALPQEEGDYLSVVMIDTDAALAVLRKDSRSASSGSGSDQAIEQRITDVALVAPEEHADLRDGAEATAFFEHLLRDRFRARLERDGHWEPFGEIAIRGGIPGTKVTFDQKPVGIAGESAMKLSGIAPGRHRVTLEHPDYAPFETVVTAERAQTATLLAALSPKPGKFHTERQVVIWSGVGVAAAGAAIFALGLSASSAEVNCWAGQPCSSSFRRFGAPASPSPLENPNGGGLPIAPLGYGLAGAGASTAIAALLMGDDDRPWIPIVIGLGVGATAFALSAVLDRANAVESAGARR